MSDYSPDVAPHGEAVRYRDMTQFAIFWRRFRTHKSAFVGIGFLLMIIVSAVFADHITPGVTPNTSFLRILSPQYAPHGPSLDHFPALLFGNIAYSDGDNSRRSVLTEVTYGSRVSLTISFVGAMLAVALGAILGAISGYFGGWRDEVLMRITDIFLSVPFLPLVAALLLFLPSGTSSITTLILLFTGLGWPSIARIVRADFLLLREQGFTEAARAQGLGAWRIIVRHLLPNALPNILYAFTSTVALFLVTEATLDFLSLGISDINLMTWGRAFANFYDDILSQSWWAIFFPGLAIVLTVLAVTAIGEALREALDVRGQS